MMAKGGRGGGPGGASSVFLPHLSPLLFPLPPVKTQRDSQAQRLTFRQAGKEGTLRGRQTEKEGDEGDGGEGGEGS